MMSYAPSFPIALAPFASALLSELSTGELAPPLEGFVVRVGPEQLSAPGRVYFDPKRLYALIQGATGDVRTLALCLGTRHHDGHVREACARALMGIDRSWAVPFVVQLIGEYVVEIVEAVRAGLPAVNKETYGEFVRENPQFMATTKRRVVSYWDCYYRVRYPDIRTYPGSLAIEEVAGMA